MARRTLSVVIAALNEAERLPTLLAGLARQDVPAELLLVDGGSRDETVALARASGMRVLEGPRGRGPQLSFGAAQAGGEVLLFLHADTELPEGAFRAVLEALADERLVGGNFRLLFDGDDGFSRWLEGFYAFLRRRGIYYGDSGIFVRRSVHDALGGMRPLKVMEDFDFVRRLQRAGPTASIGEPALVTSSRRFAGRHPAEIVLGWCVLHALYYLGLPSSVLEQLYDSRRRRQRRPDHRARSARPVPAGGAAERSGRA